MAREPLQEKELQIKKTARRRLVGAIAMVVILLIVLPFLLKDQAIDSAQDPVKITIVNEGVNSEPIPELDDVAHGFESNVNPTEVTAYTHATVLPSQQDEVSVNKNLKADTPSSKAAQASAKLEENTVKVDTQTTLQSKSQSSEKPANLDKEQMLKKQTEEKVLAKALEKDKASTDVQATVSKPQADKQKSEIITQEKTKEDKDVTNNKSVTGKFYVQYGVFSDPKNLENLKNNLNQKGFAVETENVDESGKKVRLRSKMYLRKDEALKALKTVQASGFNAIVADK